MAQQLVTHPRLVLCTRAGRRRRRNSARRRCIAQRSVVARVAGAVASGSPAASCR